MRILVSVECAIDPALIYRIGRSVWPRVVRQVVNVLAQQLVFSVVAQQFDERRVAESAIAVEIDAVDRLGRRLDQPLLLFCPLALCDI